MLIISFFLFSLQTSIINGWISCVESALRILLIQFDTKYFKDVLAELIQWKKYNKKRNLCYGFLNAFFVHFDAIVLPRNVIFALD